MRQWRKLITKKYCITFISTLIFLHFQETQTLKLSYTKEVFPFLVYFSLRYIVRHYIWVGEVVHLVPQRETHGYHWHWMTQSHVHKYESRWTKLVEPLMFEYNICMWHIHDLEIKKHFMFLNKQGHLVHPSVPDVLVPAPHHEWWT